MDYETPDGSQFSLREQWDDTGKRFIGTLITAFVEGKAYVAMSPQNMDEIDIADFTQLLEPVPPENVFPIFEQGLTVAPPFDAEYHYLKAPQFTYEDREFGRTFVADRMRSEIDMLERLSARPHRNIVQYIGCVVNDGRVTHICLQKCGGNLAQRLADGVVVQEQHEDVLTQIQDGIEHLHQMGFAHNDINPREFLCACGRQTLTDIAIENVCIDDRGKAVIVDFDAAMPFGERLLKGVEAGNGNFSHVDNDYQGLDTIRDFLLDADQQLGQSVVGE